MLHFLRPHAALFQALINEITGVPLPFDDEFFVPTLYDIIVRVPDLHLMLCSNSSNVLIPCNSESVDSSMVAPPDVTGTLIYRP